ncbi:hypothetical protein [Kangiella taiwanensis]|uniref:Uncharacterized protein n=1 Tax=Kangiella taiwanensis TaxID=1079179 RepID=A0ABP8I670_9GAMM|nr:hypothetical protein [Kangiella taiwanensis]
MSQLEKEKTTKTKGMFSLFFERKRLEEEAKIKELKQKNKD